MKKITYILVATMTLWLFLALFATGLAKITRSAPHYRHAWVSKEKLRSLARYHGTDALKITELDVSIWRAGEWIPVLKNEEI